MKLFDDILRTDADWARYAELGFAYLNRSSREDVGTVRELLEDWFSRYPLKHQADLAIRFRTPGRRGYEPAFFELLLHELLIRFGCAPIVHPSLSGTERHPDFLVEQHDASFFLEAAVVRDESDEETAARAREDRVYDALNRLDSPNFFIKVEIIQSSTQMPSGRRMRHLLAGHLRQLDPDGVLPDGWEYSGEGWRVFFRPIAKSPGLRGREGVRPVGILPMRSKWLTTREAIKAAVCVKATRYGTLDRPYVIALNVTSEWGCDDEDAVEALFGTESHVVRWTENGVEEIGTRRNPDGAWQGPNGPCNTRISAVLIVKGVEPWNISRAAMCLYYNPHAQHPLGVVLDRLPSAVVHSDLLRRRDGINSSALFGLSTTWPNTETQ